MRIYITVVLVIAGLYYAAQKNIHGLNDALVYAQKHPNSKWSPKIDYYVGMIYYHQSQYPKAQEALTQLLLDYPTSQYMSDSLFALADSAQENRQWGLAKAALARYIEENSNSKPKELEVARKKLELLKYNHGAEVPPLPAREQ